MIKGRLLLIFVVLLSLLPQAIYAQEGDIGEDGGGGIIVIIVIVILIIIVIAVISYVYGVFESFEIPKVDPKDPDGTDPCGQCRRDKEWYESQSDLKRAAVSVWWVANRTACALKGCG